MDVPVTGATPSVVHVICPEVDDSIGGADLHVLDQAEAQRDLGVDAEVVSIGAPPLFMAFAKERQVPVTVVRPVADLRAARRELAKRSSSGNARTLIHSHGYEADYLTFGARLPGAPWCGLPWVATCHGLIAPDVRHRLMNAAGRFCLRRADVVVAVSNTSGLDVALGRQTRYVVNGVRPFPATSPAERLRTRAALGATPEHALVGFVGRLSAEKRPDLFLAMAERVAARVPSARFVLVGGGPLAGELRDRVERGRTAYAVRFAGARADIGSVFASLDVLVLPSDTEGTSRVVLEAKQAGVATVATAVGPIPQLITHDCDGLLVPPDDPERLSAAVSSLVEDPRRRHRLARGDEADRFDVSAARMAQETIDVYDKDVPTWRPA